VVRRTSAAMGRAALLSVLSRSLHFGRPIETSSVGRPTSTSPAPLAYLPAIPAVSVYQRRRWDRGRLVPRPATAKRFRSTGCRCGSSSCLTGRSDERR
jgi:hypothetical protein